MIILWGDKTGGQFTHVLLLSIILQEEKEDTYRYPGLDGTFSSIEYFKCKPGYGLLLPLDVIKRDDRFSLAPVCTPPTTSAAIPEPLNPAIVTPPRGVDRSQSNPSHPLCEPVRVVPRKSSSESTEDVLLKCILEAFVKEKHSSTGTVLHMGLVRLLV